VLPLRFGLFVSMFAWPAIGAAGLQSVFGLRSTALGMLAYFVLVALIVGSSFALGRSDASIFGQVIAFWGVNCLLPTLFAAALVSRRVRAVGPVVFGWVAALVVAVPGAFLLVRWSSAALLPALTAFGFEGWTAILGLELVFGAVLSIPLILGWTLALRTAYGRKWLSDDIISADTIWLIAIISDFSATSYSDPGWSALGMLGSFSCYKLSTGIFRRWFVRAHEPRGRPPRLLYLRAFSRSSTSERSFRAIAKAWRHVGSIALITGPDFATFTIEPHELLDFVSGRLSKHFIGHASELGTRELIDERRDPDGRFRISELFCRGNAWRAVFHYLLANTDVVLADVRGLSPATPGIRFEIEQLGLHAQHSRVVLLTDRTTDRDLISAYFLHPAGYVRGFGPRVTEVTGVPARDTPHVVRALVRAAFDVPDPPGTALSAPSPSNEPGFGGARQPA